MIPFDPQIAINAGVRSIFCENNKKPEVKKTTQKFMYGDPVGPDYIRAYVAKKEPASKSRTRSKLV